MSGTFGTATKAIYMGMRGGSTNPLFGYLSDVSLINGTAVYKSNFVPPLAPLTATAGTSLLLNMDKGGVADSSRSNDLETVGDAKINYETPYAGSYYSNSFNGSSDYLSIPANAALQLTGDFTIQFWAYLTGNGGMVLGSDSGANSDYFGVSPTAVYLAVYYPSQNYPSWNVTISLNTWTHVAVTRASNTLKCYVNGVQLTLSGGSASESRQFFQASALLVGRYGASAPNYFPGSISNLQIVKGTSLYSANFTPPTAPLTAVSGTSLLTCQSKSFVDNSSNAFTITRSGTPLIKSQNPFQKNTYSSMYFDGTGDYAVSPSNAGNALGTDFTVEAWVLPNVASATYGLAIAGTYDGGTNNGWSVVINRSTGGTYGVAFIHANALQSTYGTYLTVGAWTHIAVARSGSSLKLFVNGVLVTTTVYATTDSIVAPLYVGSQGTTSSLFNGYIADLRITKSARYTATFTPPTAPLPTA
jgi:hypothetical protein